MLNKAKELYARIGRPRLANPFKRKVNIVYTSMWLHGTYVFTFKAGEKDVYQRFIDHFIGNLPEMKASEYIAVRNNPCINIKEIF